MGTKNSDLVSNFEATPTVLNSPALLHGVQRVAQGTIELAAGDSNDNDIVMLAPIPSNAVISQLDVGSDTFGGSCTFNVGIYTSAGAVKDEDYFATAVADAGAMTDLRYEVADISTAGTALYSMAGDSTDPGGFYYVAATMFAEGGTAGTMSFNITYTVN
jgi:hypothetical protein